MPYSKLLTKSNLILLITFLFLSLFLSACPKENTDLPKYDTQISLHRETNWGEAFLKYAICIDGEEMSRISNGDTEVINMTLTEGTHKIHLKKWFFKSKKIAFDVDSQSNQFSFTGKTKSSLGLNSGKINSIRAFNNC